MATILVVSLPVYGHFYHSLRCARELKNRGHHVIFMTSATKKSDLARESIKGVFVEFPDVEHPKGHSFIVVAWRFLTRTEIIFDQVVEGVSNLKFDAVVFDSLAIWGFLIARIRGVPAINLSTGPPIRSSNWDNFTFKPQDAFYSDPISHIKIAWDYYGAVYRLQNRTKILLPHFKDFFAAGDLKLFYWIKEKAIEPIPSDLVFLGHDYEEQNWNLGVDFSWFAGSCVYISLGTLSNFTLDELHAIIKELGDMPYKVLIKVDSNLLDKTGELPSNIRVSSFVNQIEVLKRASVFVSHVGANSFFEAAYFGVPVIARPQHYDQFCNAQQIVNSGAGLSFAPNELIEHLKEAINMMLFNPSFKENIRIIGDLYRKYGGSAKAAEEIENFIANTSK